MYFHESEAIANENPGLHDVVEQLDRLLATIFTAAPLRPGDFACNLGCEANQVIAVFDLLADCEILLAEKMVECEQCHNLMPAAAFQQAVADQDDFDCPSCGRTLRRRTPVTKVYRMTAETLARPKPAVATPDVELALRDLDQYPNVFRRLGQVWILKYDGQMVLMKDAVGLRHLARLVAEPERFVPAAFLLAAESGIDPRVITGNTGELIDDQGMTKYKQQYAELEEELQDAESRNDLGRIPKLQSALDALGSEILRASGLGGRTRNKNDADRARKNVSTSVTRAIDSIREEHSQLGRHFQISISCGLTLRYVPERDPCWLI